MTVNVEAIKRHYNVEIKSADSVINRLKPQLEAFERKYHLTSEEMIKKVRQDPTYETEEICIWMHNYRIFQMVANGHR